MEDLLFSLSWLAVLIATLLYFMLGAFWYSPVLFANTWMKLRNVNEEDIGDPKLVIFLYSFVLQFIAVATLATFIAAMGLEQAVHGAVIGFAIGAGILFTLAGTTGIFSETPFRLHLIDNARNGIDFSPADPWLVELRSVNPEYQR